jgi:hypothetical protein
VRCTRDPNSIVCEREGTKFILAEDHVLARAALVEKEVSGVRVGVGRVVLFDAAGRPAGRRRQAGECAEIFIQQHFEGFIDRLTPPLRMSDDKQIFGSEGAT